MQSLDIIPSESCLRNCLRLSSFQHPFLGNTSYICAFGKQKRLLPSWKVYIQMPREAKFNRWQLGWQNLPHIVAVATFETKFVAHCQDGSAPDFEMRLKNNVTSHVVHTSRDGSKGMDEREKLRRKRISKANKGHVPWNKGKKHSPETLQRIRERTKLAMQDPKVKMKLVNLGHAQSKETRIKIGVGVRIGWERRRKRFKLQETCYLKWLKLIAEASRKGFTGEDELQWDSYEVLDRQLEEEWLESIEKRKSAPRAKGSKRAPKTPQQRKKISEAISAKWADPDYRDRVCSALAKYHGTSHAPERKPKRKPSGDSSAVGRTPASKRTVESHWSTVDSCKNLHQPVYRPKTTTTPSYKDPLASSKLEMIKKIRAQRVSLETKKIEAMERARLLIAEAEKAATALEVAAETSPLAGASLMESRKLIAEATRLLEEIEIGQLTSAARVNTISSSFGSNGVMDEFHEDPRPVSNSRIPGTIVNGTKVLSLRSFDDEDSYLDKLDLHNELNGKQQIDLPPYLEEISGRQTLSLASNLIPDNSLKEPSDTINLQEGGDEEPHTAAEANEVAVRAPHAAGGKPTEKKKKEWVCGRLVEVEGD